MSVQARKTLTKYPNVTEHQAETFRTGEKIVIRRDEQVNAKKYHKYLKKEGPWKADCSVYISKFLQRFEQKREMFLSAPLRSCSLKMSLDTCTIFII